MGLGTTSVLALLLAVLIVYLPGLLRTPLPPHVTGFVAQGWEAVEEVFRRHVEAGREKGAQFSVYHKGVLVVDLAGGYADDDAVLPMATDNILWLASTVKAVSAICVALLVDRGHISYDKPVAQYWPEFAQNGKAKITVEQLLSHQGGVAALEEQFDAIDSKFEDVIASLARMPPNWPPGTGHGYHAYTILVLMDKLVRQADPKHRTIDRFFKEEIADKLGLDVFHGLPDSVAVRAARFYSPGTHGLGWDILAIATYWDMLWTAATDQSSLPYRCLTNPTRIFEPLNNPDFRRVSTNGYASAKSIAHLMGVLANTGAKTGSKVLSPEVIQRLGRPLTTGQDKVNLLNITYGLGMSLRETPSGGWMVGTPGTGGQMGYFDAETKLGWGFLRNHLSMYGTGNDPIYLELEQAMYGTLRRLENRA